MLKLIANDAIRSNASPAKDVKRLRANLEAGKSQYAGIERYVADHPLDDGI